MRQQNFVFRGVKLVYLDHKYNHASLNMRSIEVPIIERYVRQFDPRRVLEIGNVLRHYRKYTHTCVDATERGKGIYNRDVMTWRPDKRWDLVVSISTVEHIGHGRYKHITAAHYIPRAIFAKLSRFLTPSGALVVTVPLGYNSELDSAISDDDLPGVTAHFMRRLNIANEWEETDKETALATPYGAVGRWGAAMAVLAAGRDTWL